MTAKTPAPVRSNAKPAKAPVEKLWLSPPWTLAERVQRIEALGRRISGYVEFMCQIEAVTGTSNEAKERGVSEFYEQLVIVESQLRRIEENLRLE